MQRKRAGIRSTLNFSIALAYAILEIATKTAPTTYVTYNVSDLPTRSKPDLIHYSIGHENYFMAYLSNEILTTCIYIFYEL